MESYSLKRPTRRKKSFSFAVVEKKKIEPAEASRNVEIAYEANDATGEVMPGKFVVNYSLSGGDGQILIETLDEYGRVITNVASIPLAGKVASTYKTEKDKTYFFLVDETCKLFKVTLRVKGGTLKANGFYFL